jgi:hypothetical protein
MTMKAPTTLTIALLVIALFALLVNNVSAEEGLQIQKAVCGARDSWRDVTAFLRDNVLE